MGTLKISIHPTFIFFAFILVYFGWTDTFLIYIIVLFIHEYAHYFTAKKLGYKLDKMLFMPYGVCLTGNSNNFEKNHEMLIAIAGPAVNLILVIICVCLWWCFPITYHYTLDFVFSNLSLGLFNLMPFFPMDGGRLMVASLSYKFNKNKILKTMKIVSIAGGIIFACLFLLSVFYSLNLTLFFISVFLFTSSIDGGQNLYYERVDVEKNTNKPLPVKIYAVNKSCDMYKLLKYIKGNNLTQFYVMDKGKVIRIITEQDVLKYITNKNKDYL